MKQQRPKHIAIIMDGNGRWAKRRCFPRVMGHREGVRAVERTVKACIEQHIPVLTLFAFSSENWQRPSSEIKHIMQLFCQALEQKVKELHSNGVRLRFIGDCSRFDQGLQDLMQNAESLTQNNTQLLLNIAVNYGGHWDIVQATQRLAKKVEQGELQVDAIDHGVMAAHLSLADCPEPDLFIRTSGEQRISNFLLWQIAYTELYFTDTLWPDFDAAQLQNALDFYAKRDRRFGTTSDTHNHERAHA